MSHTKLDLAATSSRRSAGEWLAKNGGSTSEHEDPMARIEQVAAIMRAVLRLRPEPAHMLAQSWWCRVLEVRNSWEHAASLDLCEAIERAREFEGEQLDSLRDLMISDPRGLVLATIHMGDYLAALFGIASALRDRPFTIVRRRTLSTRDIHVFEKLQRLGIDVEVIITRDPSATMRLARRLAKGSAAILFYDLHSGFGRTQPVQFLGQQVQWVEGPVRIASACDALLVPFAATKEPASGKNQLELNSAIEIKQGKRATSERLAVLRWLASFAERQVLRYPDQWLHWAQLPRMASQ